MFFAMRKLIKIKENKDIQDVQNVWDKIFTAWFEYDKLLIDFLFENYPHHLQESLEKEKFEYLQKNIQKNISKIIKCLGFDPNPKEQLQSTSFQQVIFLFKNKKDLNTLLSKENLVRLSGKIQNTISDYNGLDKKEKNELFYLRENLSISLNNFRFYIMIYNKLSRKKEVVGLSEALKLWDKTMIPEDKRKVITEWEKYLITLM